MILSLAVAILENLFYYWKVMIVDGLIESTVV